MSNHSRRKLKADCPECGSFVSFKREPDLGQIVTCSQCGESLVIVELSPLELDWADDYDDEYGDDGWDDYDDYDK